MSFRKTLCLLAALLFGVSATAFAQTTNQADPRGVRVRIISPDSAGWAGIGRTIRVNVLRTKTLAPALDQVIVALRPDTLTSVDTLIAGAGGTITAIQTGTINNTDGITNNRFVDTLTAASITAGNGLGSAVDTFKFTFTVTAGDPEVQNVFAQAFILKSGFTGYRKLNNMNLTPMSDVGGFTDAVGDRKFVRVKGTRPVAGNVFTSVFVDTVGQRKFPGTSNPGTAAYRIGDQVKLQVNVQNFNAAQARIALYYFHPDSAFSATYPQADSALYVRNFDAATIVSAAGGVRDSFTLTAGQFRARGATRPGSAANTATSNLRLKVLGFLVDNAGNLSHPTLADAASAQGQLSPDVTHIFDTTAPTITMVNPDSAGKRFTGKVDTSLALRLNDGTIPGTTIALSPLTFRVNEGSTARWAVVGSDTANFGGTASVTNTAVVTADAFRTRLDGATVSGAARAAQAGASLTLNVVAFDSVGNKSTATLSNVTLDQRAPVVSQLFPASAALPEKKINNQTRHPIFRINEVADTISVRYVSVGASPVHVVTQSVSSALLSTVNQDIQVTVTDSLVHLNQYTLQVFIRDLAKNVNVTAVDTLTFDRNFQNPIADSFVVVSQAHTSGGTFAATDSVLAGQALRLTVTAIDSKLTRQAGAQRSAVTYNKRGALVRVVADGQDVSGVNFWGTGVTNNAGTGTANLDGGNWVIGARSVWVRSTKTLNNIRIVVEDTSTTIVDGNATKVVNFQGNKRGVHVDEADVRAYTVTAWEGGQHVTGVQGDFQVAVTPVDAWGNPSKKVFTAAIGTALTGQDSLDLRDTRATTAMKRNTIIIDFASNMADAAVPSGPQSLVGSSTSYTAVAPNRTGEGLVISVRTSNVPGDTTQASARLQLATGSMTLSFSGEGQAPPGAAPAAPKNLLVQDYPGDQGFHVMVTFPKSEGHARVSQYRVYRELDVTTGIDANGNAVVLTAAVKRWVPWVAIDAIPDTSEKVVRAVVPVTDHTATRWAVTSESGGSSTEPVVAGKRVFTKESVQQMAQFFGVDPNRIVTSEVLGEMFMPSDAYVKSIIGDQKNLVYASLDPDVASLVGAGTVPTSIRTAGEMISTSEKTLAAEPVKAVDNIAPTQVADSKVDGSIVTWTKSVDDRTVGSVSYRGFAIPIAGVEKYEIMGGATAENLALIGTVPAGTTRFESANLPSFIRVDALDIDNRTIGPVLEAAGYVTHRNLAGNIVHIVVLVGANTPYVQDFEDFIAFASSFNAVKGQPNYILQADSNQDGTVNFADFIAFASTFNQVAVTRNGQPVPATKPVIQTPGANENAEFSLSLGSEGVVVGKTVSVDVSLAQVKALTGYGFVLNYETDKFEFVEAVPASQDLLKSTGGETPLFLAQADQGQVVVANAVVNGSAVNGGGNIVRLTFNVLREFEDQARFEVAQGLVFDPKQLSNQAVVAGVLNLQSTPSEFALLQNFPNPFNPETTIHYNLATSSDVTLQIYNVVGQVVRTLVSEPQSAGRYQVRWNGTDDRGVPVSSGIYFYSVRAGKFQDVRKLMLLK